MPEIAERKIKAYDATKHIIGGLIDQSISETDVSHMFHVKETHVPIHLESIEGFGRYCAHEPPVKQCQSCDKRATHGHIGPMAVPRYCKEHAPTGFIQLTCDQCPRKVMFNLPNGGTCLIHQMEKDDHTKLTTDRYRQKCMICGKRSSYGITKQNTCGPCSALVSACLPGMMLKRIYGMCQKCGTTRAMYTHILSKEQRCKSCVETDISKYICRFPQCDCGKVAVFTATDGSDHVCSTCSRDSTKTYARLNFQCREKSCLKKSRYGTRMKKPLACNDHKLPGEFDVSSKKCNMCLVALGPEFATNVRQPPYICASHREEGISRNVRQYKEMIVVREVLRAIVRSGISIEYQQNDKRTTSLDGETNKRPDCFAVLKFETDTLAIILEVDENGHSRYLCDKRDIVSKLQMKDGHGVTIDTPRHAYRINPDFRDNPLFKTVPTLEEYQHPDYVESVYTHMERIIKYADAIATDIKSNFTEYVIAFKNFEDVDETPQSLDVYVMSGISETQ